MQRPGTRSMRRGRSACAPRQGRISAHSTSAPRRMEKPTARSGLSLHRGGCGFRRHLCGIFVPGLPLRRAAASLEACGIRGSARLCSTSGTFAPSGSSLVAVRRAKACLGRTPLPTPPRKRVMFVPPARFNSWGRPRSAQLAGSLNLLEPTTSCTEADGCVNEKRIFSAGFIAAHHQSLSGRDRWETCG